MTDFAYTGKKGTGKSKNAVLTARDTYFAEGRKVASNLDIFLEPMFGPYSKHTYVRIPDKPTAHDLLAAGHGNPDSYDEDHNGALILDELGTWLNTRTFSDKDRGGTLDYLAHARKHGWDCIYIMQNIVQVDKQLRESFIEIVVRHTRFDKVKIPFVGGIICALFGKKAGYFPRFHTAVSRIGCNPQDMRIDSSVFVGKDVEKCYDTRQIFESGYEHGSYSVLSPWHVKGRFLESAQPSAFTQLLDALAAFGRGVVRWHRPPVRPVARPSSFQPGAAYSRVLALARRLPLDQRIHVMRLAERAERAASGMR